MNNFIVNIVEGGVWIVFFFFNRIIGVFEGVLYIGVFWFYWNVEVRFLDFGI